jgi:EpsI family protein
MLLVAYSRLQAGETGIHRPEVCYPAAGFRLRRWPDLPLVLPGMRITAPTFTAFAPERIEQMLYWSRIGRDFPTSSLSQRWTMLKQAVQGSLPDGVLVRMSTIQPDRAAGLRSLEQFARELLGGASPALSALLTGRR